MIARPQLLFYHTRVHTRVYEVGKPPRRILRLYASTYDSVGNQLHPRPHPVVDPTIPIRQYQKYLPLATPHPPRDSYLGPHPLNIKRRRPCGKIQKMPSLIPFDTGSYKCANKHIPTTRNAHHVLRANLKPNPTFQVIRVLKVAPAGIVISTRGSTPLLGKRLNSD